MRVDFFGDEVDQIRRFAVSDQRSAGDPLPTIELWPARELLLTEDVRERALQLLPRFPALSTLLEKVSQGIAVEGMESLLPQLLPSLKPLTALLPDDAAVMVIAPERVAGRAVSLAETNREFLEAAWAAATAGADAPVPTDNHGMLTMVELREAAEARPWQTLTGFVADAGDEGVASEVSSLGSGEDRLGQSKVALDGPPEAGIVWGQVVVDGRPLPRPTPGADAGVATMESLRERLKLGWRIVVTAQGTGLVERARDVLAESDFAARMVESLPEQLEEGVIYLTPGTAWSGFESPEARSFLVSEAEFFGRAVSQHHAPTKLAKRRGKNVVDPLQLQPGDYVVHETHGIGQFVELTQRMVPTGVGRSAADRGKALREYLVLEYASTKRGMPKDKLFCAD